MRHLQSNITLLATLLTVLPSRSSARLLVQPSSLLLSMTVSLRLLHSSKLLPANPSAGIQSNQSSCNNKDDTEDDNDACFLFGPVLTLGDGVIMERAGGDGESGG